MTNASVAAVVAAAVATAAAKARSQSAETAFANKARQLEAAQEEARAARSSERALHLRQVARTRRAQVNPEARGRTLHDARVSIRSVGAYCSAATVILAGVPQTRRSAKPLARNSFHVLFLCFAVLVPSVCSRSRTVCSLALQCSDRVKCDRRSCVPDSWLRSRSPASPCSMCEAIRSERPRLDGVAARVRAPWRLCSAVARPVPLIVFMWFGAPCLGDRAFRSWSVLLMY